MADRMEQDLHGNTASDQRKQAAAAVDQLERAVQDDVAKWNEHNPGYRQRFEAVRKLMPSGAFRLCKTSFPPAAVNAVLDSESFCVNVETTTVSSEGQEQCSVQSHFMLAPEKNGFRLMRETGEVMSFAAVSRLLLEPIMASASFWARRASGLENSAAGQ